MNIINKILVYLGIIHYMPFVNHVISYEHYIRKKYPESYKGNIIHNGINYDHYMPRYYNSNYNSFNSIAALEKYYYGNIPDDTFKG